MFTPRFLPWGAPRRKILIAKELICLSFDLHEYKGKKVHIIGIGGSMMSGIAGILLENGIKGSGTGQGEAKTLDWVRRLGASVKGGHHRD